MLGLGKSIWALSVDYVTAPVDIGRHFGSLGVNFGIWKVYFSPLKFDFTHWGVIFGPFGFNFWPLRVNFGPLGVVF